MGTDQPGQGRRRWWLEGGLIALLLVFVAGCGPHREAPPPPPPPVVQKADPHLVLRLGERRLYVMQEEVKLPPLAGYPVAIGRTQFPTPTGRFQINELVENPDFLAFDFNNPKAPNRGRVPPGPNNPLGLRWIGFATAHGWQVGFHGTAKTSVLGQAVSHGCVRMSNPEVVELYSRVQLGTVVVVEP